MNPFVEINLALILFLPWYVILGVLFAVYPRQPRGARRRAFDVSALGLAGISAAVATHWGFAHADAGWGGMWKQVFATSLSYGVFLFVLALALFLRRALARAGSLN